MISTMTSRGHTVIRRMGRATESAHSDRIDERSSSLSDVEDEQASDDEGDATMSKRTGDQADAEVDSEAETERLEKTPNKLNAAIEGLRSLSEKSPSKLSQVINRNGKEVADDYDDADDDDDNDNDDDDSRRTISLSMDQDQPTSTLSRNASGSTASRKRKRPSPDASSVSDTLVDERSPKKQHSSNKRMDDDDVSLNEGDLVPEKDVSDMDMDVQDDATSMIDGQDINGLEPEELPEVEEVALHTVRRGKKGRRRGRKPAAAAVVVVEEVDIAAEASDAMAQEIDEAGGDVEAGDVEAGDVEAGDVEAGDAEVDEEEGSSHDEELARRKVAADALAEIEKDFTAFRAKHVGEQLRQIENELDLLDHSNCTHPEFLAQLRCVDERRDEKIRYEDTLLKFKLQSLAIKTVSERGQLHTQYYQDIRHIRDVSLERCYKELYALQRDRRNFGADDTNYTMLYNPKRGEQITRQTAYNLEVSILSGIAKNVGFPAAPDMSALAAPDVESDFQAMGVSSRRHSQLVPSQPAVDASRTTDCSLAEQFLEQTPWANPQHPAHAQSLAGSLHTTQLGHVNLTTPVYQRRYVDTNTVNGSASTIDLISNPASSAPGLANRMPDHVPASDAAHHDSPVPNSSSRTPSGGAFQTPNAHWQESGSIYSIQDSSGASRTAQPSSSRSPRSKSIRMTDGMPQGSQPFRVELQGE